MELAIKYIHLVKKKRIKASLPIKAFKGLLNQHLKHSYETVIQATSSVNCVNLLFY